ncbi:MAG: hypothetical protein QOG27_369 [Verrucomicrobiota bacterium]
MRPWAIHGLHLTDDSLFKIEPALPPAENLSDRRFPFERPEHRVPDRPVREVNLAVAAAGLESKPATALAQAAHLQNFGRRKLVEITDERVARIDAFRRRSALRERTDEGVQLPAQASVAAIACNSGNLLLPGRLGEVHFPGFRSETDDSQGWEMLASVRSLFHGDGGFSLDHESNEILGQKHADRLRERPDYTGLDIVDFVQNAQGPVLKDRVSIQYEESSFHKCALNGKK